MGVSGPSLLVESTASMITPQMKCQYMMYVATILAHARCILKPITFFTLRVSVTNLPFNQLSVNENMSLQHAESNVSCGRKGIPSKVNICIVHIC